MELNMTLDARRKDLETLRGIFVRFPEVTSVRVFGSRVAGSARRASDIDLAVSAPEMSASAWSDLRTALDDAPIIYDMDIVRVETLADEKLRTRIDSEGIEIYPKHVSS